MILIFQRSLNNIIINDYKSFYQNYIINSDKMGCTQAKIPGTNMEILEMKISKLPKNKRITKTLFDTSSLKVRNCLTVLMDLANDGIVSPDQDELENVAIASLDDKETLIFTIIILRIAKHAMLCPGTHLFKTINEMSEYERKKTLENTVGAIISTSNLLKMI